jgi:hypothetical protein
MNDGFPHARGSVLKDSRYLTTLQGRTKGASHPRNQHVAMQAHHAVSAKGVSMTRHGDRLADLGYDINDAMNLVFIPCTLQGACLLQVQPHRGNHTATDPADVDGNRDPSYHDRVATMINGAMKDLERDCGRPGLNVKDHTQKEIDKLSALLVHMIQFRPQMAKLTRLYAHFGPGQKRGCGGVDSVRAPDAKILDVCPVHRDHTLKQGPGQEVEGISFKLAGPYKLEPGK